MPWRRDGFLPHVSLGSGIQASSEGLDAFWNPMPVALGWGVACLEPPKGLLGNAHTLPGWPTRHCPVVSVQQGLGFGYSSETELKAPLLPADQ